MVVQEPLGFQANIGRLRPSDADRSRAVDVLAAAFSEGRLDGAEHRRRVETALRATSYQELSDLIIDVPAGPLPIPGQAWPKAVKYDHRPSLPYYPAPQSVPYQPLTLPAYQPLPTDGCAVASLVLSLVSPFLFFLCGVPSAAAIITGHIALARADRHSPGSRGMAMAGLVFGYLGTALALLIVVLEVTLSSP